MINNIGQFIKKNGAFFSIIALFLIIAGTILANIEQGQAIYYFSDRRSAFGDFFFRYATILGEEWAYGIIVIILVVLKKYRAAVWVPITGILISAISFGLKSWFKHPRPLLYFTRNGEIDDLNLVEGIQLYGGQNSFPSGHTISGFALYAFLAFYAGKKNTTGPIFAGIAIVIGISRIYLIQHFLQDVVAGAGIGILTGAIAYALMKKTEHIGRKKKA